MSVRQLAAILIGICTVPLWLAACNKSNPPVTSTPPVQATETPSQMPEPSATPAPPTVTPVPMAAMVNGEGITLAEFQAEVRRYQAATVITGTILAPDVNTIVMDELIDQTLLAQAAVDNGYTVDATQVQSRISALEEQLGGAQALLDWENSHGYSSEDFSQALKRSIEAAWMRDQIIARVPETAEQVHVLQILMPSSARAEEAYYRLQAGEDFVDLAAEYDPMTRGDLGWFPRGYLSDLKIEEAAFALQPGEYSAVIQNEVGFHILYVVERETEYPLSPDARRALQQVALQDWIKARRDQSQIQVMVP